MSDSLYLFGGILLVALLAYCCGSCDTDDRHNEIISQWMKARMESVYCARWERNDLCICIGEADSTNYFAFVAPPGVCGLSKIN